MDARTLPTILEWLPKADQAKVLDARETMGRKFEAFDMADTALGHIAERYTAGYGVEFQGDFAYMLDLHVSQQQYGGLTPFQRKGALNCLVNQLQTAMRTSISTAPRTPPTMSRAYAPVPDGIYTIIDPVTGTWRTLRIETEPRWLTNAHPGTQVASFLAGPDNEKDFVGFAFIDAYGGVRMWRKFQDNLALVTLIDTLVASDQEARQTAGLTYAQRSGNCWRCGRTLTVPVSLNAGLGPECAKKLNVDRTKAPKKIAVNFKDAEARKQAADALAPLTVDELF